jgi:hypothetical protein
MALPPDDPFDRQPGEPARAFHAFCHFRDNFPRSSIDKAWRDHKTTCDHVGLNEVSNRRRPTSWAVWSVRWGWIERAGAFSSHLDQQKRLALEAEQVAAAQRHARVLQAGISAVTIPLRIAIEAAASPTGLEKLRTAALASAAGLRVAVSEARLSAATLPALVAAERLVLGMATEHHQLTESPTFDPIAARIATDPAAMDAAIRLLNLVATPPPD